MIDKTQRKWLALLAAPAAAGMLAMGAAGCDDNEADEMDGTATGDATMSDPYEDPYGNSGMDTGDDSVTDQLSQLSENLQEALEAEKDKVEENADGDTGSADMATGNATSEMLGNANEIADRLQAAVEDKDMAEAARALAELQAMKGQFPPNIQGMLTQIQNAMPGGGTGAAPAMPAGGDIGSVQDE